MTNVNVASVNDGTMTAEPRLSFGYFQAADRCPTIVHGHSERVNDQVADLRGSVTHSAGSLALHFGPGDRLNGVEDHRGELISVGQGLRLLMPWLTTIFNFILLTAWVPMAEEWKDSLEHDASATT